MVTREEWKNRVAFHPGTPNVASTYDELRTVIYQAGLRIIENTRSSREQSLALTKLEEAFMWASKAVAIHEIPMSEEWQSRT